MPAIVPAIIARTQMELNRMLVKIEGRFDRIMLDIMDGRFVSMKSLTFDPILFEGFEYEAHLMVQNPIQHIIRLSPNVHRAIIHTETEDPEDSLVEADSRGLKTSIALNPLTPVREIRDYLELIDGVTVMTVIPGGYGHEFIPEALEKIREIKQLNPCLEVEVDGGMDPDTAKLAVNAGADVIASGSFLMKSADIDEALEMLKSAQ